MSESETWKIIFSNGKIPIEITQPTIELTDILLKNLPFMLTALIVLSAAVVTYISNRRSVESQNKLSRQARIDEHENKISEFRHEWIQDVRETSSKLCQILHELQVYTMQRNINRENQRVAIRKGDDYSGEQFDKLASESYQNLVIKRSEYYRVSSKLKLLFKKDDPSTSAVFKLINDVKDDINDFEKMHLEESEIDKIILHFQEILKSEWEVTKERTWHKGKTN